ncbi:MAG: ATP-binding protein [Oscillospiraceae bacterium]
MGNESFNGALKTVEGRRLSATADLFKRKDEIYASCPEIEDLGFEITSAGASYTLASMAKDTQRAAQLHEVMLQLTKKRTELLLSHGYSADALELHPFCSKCGDTGFVEGKPCSCVKAEMIRHRQKLLSSLSPAPKADFKEFSLDYYPKETIQMPDGKLISPHSHMKQIYDYCLSYSEYFSLRSKSLLMLGTAGLGKTHLACSIAKTCMEKGFTVMYSSSQSLFEQLEQARYTGEDLLSDILSCDLFILDDLGSENITPYCNSIFYNIVNTRMINGTPCIYTTNIGTQQLMSKRYGEKITSRLMGSCVRLAFVGNDIRILRNR